jgi:thymidylate synthase
MLQSDWHYISNLMAINNEGAMDQNPRAKYEDGTPAYSRFITGVFEMYNIALGDFPIPTLRNTAVKTGIREILWIYQKQTSSLKVARELGVNWWESWNVGDDSIGTVYGHTVNRYQLMNTLLNGLQHDPFSRRHIINLYQQEELNDNPGLYPCAYETLWSIRPGYEKNEYMLDMTLVQRSNDYLVAGYINKIQYVALMMMVVGHLNHVSKGNRYFTGKFRHLVQNLHVYDRHQDALTEILSREPIQNVDPRIVLRENKNFYDYTIDDFEVIDNVGQKLLSPLEVAV